MRTEKRLLELAPDHAETVYQPASKQPKWALFTELGPDGVTRYDCVPEEALNPPPPPPTLLKNMSKRLRKLFNLEKGNGRQDVS